MNVVGQHVQIVASFPGLHAQLLLLAVRKVGGRPGRSRHVIRAAIDVTASLLELITQGVRPPYVPILVPVLTTMEGYRASRHHIGREYESSELR